MDQLYYSGSPPDAEIYDGVCAETSVEPLLPVGLLGGPTTNDLGEDTLSSFDRHPPSPAQFGTPDAEDPAQSWALMPVGFLGGPASMPPDAQEQQGQTRAAFTITSGPAQDATPLLSPIALVGCPNTFASAPHTATPPVEPGRLVPRPPPDAFVLRPSGLVGLGNRSDMGPPSSTLPPRTALALRAHEWHRGGTVDDPAVSPPLLIPTGPLGYATVPAQTPSDSSSSVMVHPGPWPVTECGSDTTSYLGHWQFLEVPLSMQGSEFEALPEQETALLTPGPRSGRRDSLGGREDHAAGRLSHRPGETEHRSSEGTAGMEGARGNGGDRAEEEGGAALARTMQSISDLCDDLMEHISEEAGARWMYYNDLIVAAAEGEGMEGNDM
ncbi:hypothetical protein C8Q76DRAFT_698090 [Earliella scabrosa]|nr:hypothetical protein C8Q76DRAFT_698090 [Earliella scabrosa]